MLTSTCSASASTHMIWVRGAGGVERGEGGEVLAAGDEGAYLVVEHRREAAGAR